jgi:hypothetical protein
MKARISFQDPVFFVGVDPPKSRGVGIDRPRARGVTFEPPALRFWDTLEEGLRALKDLALAIWQQYQGQGGLIGRVTLYATEREISHSAAPERLFEPEARLHQKVTGWVFVFDESRPAERTEYSKWEVKVWVALHEDPGLELDFGRRG